MFDAQNKEKLAKLVLSGCFVLLVATSQFACESGLGPPTDLAAATIRGSVTYLGVWPPADSVKDLRFVALRFVPIDTTDFLQLNRMEVSERLAYGVASDTFTISDVQPGVFPYSGIARQITNNLFSWAPLGLYNENAGVIELNEGQVLEVTITVDFADIPNFPKAADVPLSR